MLARQVTGAEVDAPLAAVIAADVGDENATMPMLAAALTADGVQSVVLEAGGDDRGDATDDIDDDVEPEPEAIIPPPPRLGVSPLPPEEFEAAAVATVSTPFQAER
jgi:hypothetical protein